MLVCGGSRLAASLQFREPAAMTRRVLMFVCALLAMAGVARANDNPADGKLDAALAQRVQLDAARPSKGAGSSPAASRSSRVIVRTADGRPAAGLIAMAGGRPGRYFPSLGTQVADVPNNQLAWLAGQPEIAGVSLDREVRGTLARTERAATEIGARWISQQLGVDGSGVGVATIDSGIAASHGDLEGRVAHFADFVGSQALPYDDYGHGTHVAGIIAGSGRDSDGAHRGIAPGAHLVVLKALDVSGNGFTSNVIAAIEYAIANRALYNIRVLNLSVAAGVYESYLKDPLTLAARRAVDAGIVVVAAAGNHGRGANGRAQYGGISSPGNAPWVLTIGAAHDLGTTDRRDDIVAPFSSRGPAAIDGASKPDLIAPGVAIESTTDSSTALFAANPGSRIWGTAKTGNEPYLSLTGTSMAAPVVTGVIALMVDANPALTPNAIKAILQYTAESRDGYDALSQGAGLLNARGAVELAREFAGEPPLGATPDPVRWSRRVIWGNTQLDLTSLSAQSNAWRLGVTWGDAQSAAGEAITMAGARR
jgi:serine protease AprX